MYYYCAYANFPNIWLVNRTGLLKTWLITKVKSKRYDKVCKLWALHVYMR